MSTLPSVVPRPPIQPSAVPAAPEESIVARWTVEDREVRLLRQQDNLAFSVYANGSEIKRGPIPLNLYDINYALNLMTLFHKVIETNLSKGTVAPSAFLPIVCTDALRLQNQQLAAASDVKVALFGHVNVLTGDVVDGRFGIWNTLDDSVQSMDMDEQSETTRQFLLNAPRYDLPHEDKKSTHHYAMSSYAKHFRPVISCSPARRIQSVAMQRISLINRDVVIDENNWAVTLLSANGGGFLSGVGDSNGHAMMACEGVRKNINGDESQFLTYAHITTNNKEEGVPDPGRGSGARVDLFDREVPLTDSYAYGPTWVQSKDLVEGMLQAIRNAAEVHQYVAFNRAGDVSSRFMEDLQGRRVTAEDRARSPIRSAVREYFDSVSMGAFLVGAKLEVLRSGGLGTNCKDWCVAQLKRADIHLRMPPDVFSPKTFIEKLNADPSVRISGPGAARKD